MALGILNQRTVRSFILIYPFKRTMLVAERFIAYLIDKYGKHPISTDGGTCIIHLKHVSFYNWITIYIPFMKSLIKRRIQFNSSRIEPKNALMITFHAKERNVN
jgi:hypothetical protein